MNINKATVVLNRDAGDLVILRADLPSSMPKVTTQNLSLTFYSEYDKGKEYVETNFPNIPIEIIPRI